MIRSSCIGLLLGVLSMHAPDARAQYLAERLVPPQQVPLSPLPMIAQPAAPRVFGAEKPRPHLWPLPFGTFPGASAVLSTETRPANWHRPVLDAPALASERDPSRPQFPLQRTAPGVRAPGPDPQSRPWDRFPRVVDAAVLPAEDPTFNEAFGVITRSVPLATPVSPAGLRLSVPDPFEHLAAIRLPNPPVESGEPAVARDRPPMVKLPEAAPPK